MQKQALYGKVKAPVITKDIGQFILPEISKIGSNVNQIARKLNQGGHPVISEFTEIQAEFETLWAYVLEGRSRKRGKNMAYVKVGTTKNAVAALRYGEHEKALSAGELIVRRYRNGEPTLYR